MTVTLFTLRYHKFLSRYKNTDFNRYKKTVHNIDILVNI